MRTVTSCLSVNQKAQIDWSEREPYLVLFGCFVVFSERYWQILGWIRRPIDARFSSEKDFLWVSARKTSFRRSMKKCPSSWNQRETFAVCLEWKWLIFKVFVYSVLCAWRKARAVYSVAYVYIGFWYASPMNLLHLSFQILQTISIMFWNLINHIAMYVISAFLSRLESAVWNALLGSSYETFSFGLNGPMPRRKPMRAIRIWPWRTHHRKPTFEKVWATSSWLTLTFVGQRWTTRERTTRKMMKRSRECPNRALKNSISTSRHGKAGKARCLPRAILSSGNKSSVKTQFIVPSVVPIFSKNQSKSSTIHMATIPMEPISPLPYRHHPPCPPLSPSGKKKDLPHSFEIVFFLSYSISKIPKSNLMMIYVNHSRETSQLCAKLLIKRKPVEFTPGEWCTRLKTTPYRERPHKCFFVHDGESKALFPDCENACRIFAPSTWILLIGMLLIRFAHERRTWTSRGNQAAHISRW